MINRDKEVANNILKGFVNPAEQLRIKEIALGDMLNQLEKDGIEKGRKPEPLGTRKRWGSIDYIKTANGWTAKKEIKEAHDKIHQDKYESENKDSNKLHYTKETEIHAINKIAKEGLKTTKHHNQEDGSGYFEIHKDEDKPLSFDEFKSSVKIERGSGYGQYNVSVGDHKFHSTNSKAFDADEEEDGAEKYNDAMQSLYNEYKNSLS